MTDEVKGKRVNGLEYIRHLMQMDHDHLEREFIAILSIGIPHGYTVAREEPREKFLTTPDGRNRYMLDKFVLIQEGEQCGND
jgi:hypothetical protein